MKHCFLLPFVILFGLVHLIVIIFSFLFASDMTGIESKMKNTFNYLYDHKVAVKISYLISGILWYCLFEFYLTDLINNWIDKNF